MGDVALRHEGPSSARTFASSAVFVTVLAATMIDVLVPPSGRDAGLGG